MYFVQEMIAQYNVVTNFIYRPKKFLFSSFFRPACEDAMSKSASTERELFGGDREREERERERV